MYIERIPIKFNEKSCRNFFQYHWRRKNLPTVIISLGYYCAVILFCENKSNIFNSTSIYFLLLSFSHTHTHANTPKNTRARVSRSVGT